MAGTMGDSSQGRGSWMPIQVGMRHDPVTEIELSERSWTAMERESEHLLSELHRRVIDARTEAKRVALDRLLMRIDAVISTS